MSPDTDVRCGSWWRSRTARVVRALRRAGEERRANDIEAWALECLCGDLVKQRDIDRLFALNDAMVRAGAPRGPDGWVGP